MLLTEKTALERVLAYVVEGNTAQMNDPAFVDELKSWIRFGSREAVKTGDGLYSATSGNPSAPRWIGNSLFDLFFRKKTKTTNMQSNCAVLPVLRFLFLKPMTRRIGSRQGAATSVSPYRPLPWASATRWSTSRWRSPGCGPSLRRRWASAVEVAAADPIWWCGLDVARRCPNHCDATCGTCWFNPNALSPKTSAPWQKLRFA